MQYETILSAALICIVCLLVNIPFGMLRARVKRFSVTWFLCIHFPIPLIFFMRNNAGFGWEYVPLFLVFGVAGQIAGNAIISKISKNS